jgi:hypothetical protein
MLIFFNLGQIECENKNHDDLEGSNIFCAIGLILAKVLKGKTPQQVN